MKALAHFWWRAFLIVFCTSLNVTQIALGHYATAFVTGGILSFVWWGNTRSAAHTDAPGAQYAYAFGAACGTVCGMALGRWWNA